jgi:starch synthase (maltosyl-transferring)
MSVPSSNLALAVYYIHPRLAGDTAGWDAWLAHAKGLGFTHVAIAPPFDSGSSDDVFLTADHRVARSGTPSLAQLAKAAHQHGLKLILDVVMDRLSADAPVHRAHTDWFRPVFAEHGTPDPRWTPSEGEAVLWRYNDPAVLASALQWWAERLSAHVGEGVDGFRLLAPAVFDAEQWTGLIKQVRASKQALFLAWTPGISPADLELLVGAPFDATFASTPWWDYRDPWYLAENARLERVASPIAPVEAPFGSRLADDRGEFGPFERAHRRAIDFATTHAAGWLMPMGFEMGAHDVLDARRGEAVTPEVMRAGSALAIDDAIRAANARMASHRCDERVQSRTTNQVSAWVFVDRLPVGRAHEARVVLANADLVNERCLPVSQLSRGPVSGFSLPAGDRGDIIALAPGEVREFTLEPTRPIVAKVASATARRELEQATAMPRIAIEAVTPQVDDGRFPAKRVVGDSVVVEADIFMDGHDVLAAVLRWRALDERQWREVPMRPQGNDRYRASFIPPRIGRYEFGVVAWRDAFATYHHELEAKVGAGQEVPLELEEGRRLVEKTLRASSGSKTRPLKALLAALDKAQDPERTERLLDPGTAQIMHAADPRPFCVESPLLRLEVDRRAAEFASWYELFPRSATDDANRHGTFRDVIKRLPDIQAMGFDVLYFPPIHPIGQAFRKGRNNTLTPSDTDVGSPYAIGSAEGGHTDIHTQLGSIEDFRALRDAAAAHGLELALDFAIQCSQDHPWLKEHPDWFDYRPDGSIKYAENPPKKYQDIVNVDFYTQGAVPSLWQALCDVVLYWAGEGVRTFRVDNPHTKPFPFWEWMIQRVRAQYPDALFLAEAFTRPKPMYRLAKAGFSQSYTYFTWRHTKEEFIQYLTELTTTGPEDFFRPNFFVNTPDINPYFLQRSGRTGFLIRAALASTLSGLWGVYSGFELCEATPLPGKEEYLDSEKFEIRPRDYAAPGNIVAEITQLNRIRREHPALQSHHRVRFLPSGNAQVLVFEKATAERDDIVLVAINLDPHAAQSTDFYLPLVAWGLPDGAAVQARDLIHDASSTWSVARQDVWLGQGMPYAIWHITFQGA